MESQMRFHNLIQLLQKGLRAEARGEVENALNIYTTILEDSRTNVYPEGVALSALQIGMLIRPDHPFKALELYQESFSATQKANMKMDEIAGNALHNMGTAYIQLEKYSMAELKLKESLAIRRQLGRKIDIVNGLNNLVIALIYQNKWNEAYNYGIEAKKISKQGRDKYAYARILINLVTVCMEQNKNREAARYYKQVTRLLSKLGTPEAHSLQVELEEIRMKSSPSLTQAVEKHPTFFKWLVSKLSFHRRITEETTLNTNEQMRNQQGESLFVHSRGPTTRAPELESHKGEMDLTQALVDLGIMPELRKSLETFNEGTCAFCGNYLPEQLPRDTEAEEYLKQLQIAQVMITSSQDSSKSEKHEIQLYLCPYCGKHTGLGLGKTTSSQPSGQVTSIRSRQRASSTPSSNFQISEISTPTFGNMCVVPKNILTIVQDLCTRKTEVINWYAIWCLSLLIDSLILFDKVVIYNYNPLVEAAKPFNAKSSIFKPLYSQNQGGLIDVLESAGCLEYADPYIGQPLADQAKTLSKVGAAFRTKHGQLVIPGIARCPEVLLAKNNTWLQQLDMSAVQASLSTIDAVSYPDNFESNERSRFFRQYAGNKTWQIETGRQVREASNAHHIAIQPTWQPFWQQEREVIVASFQQGQSQFKGQELVRFLGIDPLISFPSYTNAVLTRMTSAKDLPQAILDTRGELSSLRKLSKRYRELLSGAVTHLDINDAIQQWRTTCNSLLSKTSQPQNGLTMNLFGWDLIKTGPLKEVLLGSRKMINSYEQHVTILSELVLTGQFNRHLDSSAHIETRLVKLFGEIR